jgi:hypothetical protein
MANHGVQEALKVGEIVCEAAGSVALYASSPFDRRRRDLITMSNHIRLFPLLPKLATNQTLLSLNFEVTHGRKRALSRQCSPVENDPMQTSNNSRLKLTSRR